MKKHLIRLTGAGQWAAWRWVCLRGAGFAASELLRLSSAACAEAVNNLIHAGDEEERSRQNLMHMLETDLANTNGAEYKTLRETTRAFKECLKKNRLPEKTGVGPAVQQAIDTWHKAHLKAAAAERQFERVYESEVSHISHQITEIAASERFREAVLWQSRHAFHTGLESLLKPPVEGNHKRNTHRRQHEELVASYLQRYCAKNDTIGFFGPVGWARFVDDGPAVVPQPGKSLTARRTVYFESWCIDALADAIIEGDRRILQWAAPRLLPVCCLDGAFLKLPLEKPIPLSIGQQTLLRACDGEMPAEEIARRLTSEYPDEFRSEANVYRVLEYLRLKGLIAWTFEVPFNPHPERTLRRLLNRVVDPALLHIALNKLGALEDARTEVAQAAGDTATLEGALSNLQTTFTQVTGKDSSRSAGKMYAGRTLVYEDCRRDIDVQLGPQLLAALGPPLELLLTSARWLTSEIAAEVRRLTKEAYVDLASQCDGGVVDGITFWPRVLNELTSSSAKSITAVKSSFQDRWATILDLEQNEPRVARESQLLKPHVFKVFNASGPGWPAARYHSPDVMVVASSVEAIRQGDFELVMGELHAGINTLGLSLFLEQHPAKQELFDAAAQDIPEPRIVVSPPRYGGLSGRNHTALVLPRDFRLEFSASSDKVEVGRPLPLRDLLIQESNGELLVKTRDGRHEFEIVEALADALASHSLNGFRILQPAGHLPRVSIDRLVVSRESWVFTASELAFAYEKSGSRRFACARRWAITNSMPQLVFMKSPVETKPVYVDFNSPIYVDLLARIIRRTKESKGDDEAIVISEMLPRLDQTWLPDRDGRRYTSEFRIVAVDLC